MKTLKHIALAFAACLVLVLFAQPAQAAGGQYGAFTYELKGNGTAVITKFDWSKHSGGDVYVPRSIDGYTVTTIGKLAFSGSAADIQHRDIRIYEDIYYDQHIHGYTVTVVLPDTITVIEEMAFMWSGISACDIPASVQLIGPGAFAGCVNIQRFTVNSQNPTYAVIDGVLFNKVRKELVAFPLGNDTISYEIPNGIVSVGDYAFFFAGRGVDTSYFTSTDKRERDISFTFPKSVTKIGNYAFYGARLNGYTSSNLYAREIGDYAFAYSRLPHVDCWAAPETIGAYAFYGCDSVFEPGISCKNLSELGEGAFMDAALSILHFEQSTITEIPAYAFYDGVRPATIPDTVISIGKYAYARTNPSVSHSRSFTEYVIPASVKTIDDFAFSNSSGTITFAEGSRLRSIGDWAFDDFNTRTDIILPEGLTSIGKRAFYLRYAEGAQMVYIPASVTSIGSDVVNRTKTVLDVEPGSYAEIWAIENGIPLHADDDTSWLFE